MGDLGIKQSSITFVELDSNTTPKAIAEKYDISVLRESIVRTVGAWLKENNVVVAAEWICRSLVMGVPPPPKLVVKISGNKERS